MLLFVFLLSTILTLGCAHPKKENAKHLMDQSNSSEKVTNYIHRFPIEKMQININTKGNILMINDTLLYSKNFIKDLYQLNSEIKSLILIDDTLYYSNDGKNEYSEPLPTELPLNRVSIYESEDDKNQYILRLTRVNLTNVSYELLINDSLKKSGTGLLNGSFFVAAEAEEDKKENAGILCRSYNDSINPFIMIKVEIDTGYRVVLYMYNEKYRFEGLIFRKK